MAVRPGAVGKGLSAPGSAVRYGVAMRALRRLLLEVGVLGLVVAGAGYAHAGASPTPAVGSVTVQPGDSLWAIAQRYDTTVAALQEANHLTSDALRPGTTLRLPAGSNASPNVYVVQPGDSLYDIALAFHLSVDDLIAYNQLSGSVIRPGQTLALRPGPLTPSALRFTVRPGDTLWGIAQLYGVSVATLASANGIATQALLHPGESLRVPGRYAGVARDVGGVAPPTVTVTKGDSLWSIAHAYGTTIAALMSANGLSTTELFPGQVLTVILPGQLGRALPPSAQPQPGSLNAMIWPIHGRITSYFGFRLLRVAGSNFHTGIDIAGHVGEPIHAAIGGTVALAGWNGGYGLCVIIRDGDIDYYYGHASALLVKRGEAVRAGQVIARVGSTGYSTGPHLHFEVRVNNQPVDPLPYLDPAAGR